MKMPLKLLPYLPIARRLLAGGRLPGLLVAVARKGGSRGVMSRLREQLALLRQLCVAWWKGEYRAVSVQAMVSIVAALLYFLSPLDALPDWIPGLGFIDDVAVLSWVFRKWSAELAAFRTWRDSMSASERAALDQLPASAQASSKG
jgi:uncharacterized membrane protein YkvA (DUF1232 family)